MAEESERCVVVFTKPARPGRVKTRLVGALTPEQAAELHSAFFGDVVERLSAGKFRLVVAWALQDEEPLPAEWPLGGFRQVGADLGDRLYHGLELASGDHDLVAAVGSDHPELPLERVEEAFGSLAEGADVVLGPAEDGGFYLVAVRREVLATALFESVPWSSGEVLTKTLENCRGAGLEVTLLPWGTDVDVPADLDRLTSRLADEELDCPRTHALLRSWGRISTEVSQ